VRILHANLIRHFERFRQSRRIDPGISAGFPQRGKNIFRRDVADQIVSCKGAAAKSGDRRVEARHSPLERGQHVLIATLDDLAAVYAKNAVEMNRRQSDCIIVSQGLDRNIHGSASEKKEIDPNNRGSVVLGSVAYYMDRYGYEVLPLALRLLAGEKLPPRAVTQHILVTAANVFREYPPFDMN